MREGMDEEEKERAYRQEGGNQYCADVDTHFLLLSRFGLGYSNAPGEAVGYKVCDSFHHFSFSFPVRALL
jgi:hypothetical protein